MSTAASSTTEPNHTEAEKQHGRKGTAGGYSDRQLGFWLIGAGLIALISSAILVYERLQIYIDAGHSTVCDINALLSCGTVMRTPQADQTTFQINALCLFCMIVWVMTITLFVKTTVRNISVGVIPASQSMRESARGWSWFAISLWLILIFGIIVIRFFEVIVNMMR